MRRARNQNGKEVERPVSDQKALEAACERLRSGVFIALDTEFHRESSYWPHLCLIQAAVEGFDVIIDPLAEGLNLEPFLELLLDQERVKVFHAGRQDMEIFTRLLGSPPKPIFDTQIAAMACGLGDSVSYEGLVSVILGRSLDKGPRFSNWMNRPLSPEQLRYARLDATLLRDIYPVLEQRLRERGRLAWIREEIVMLESADTYETAPEQAWKRLKRRKSDQGYRVMLAALAAWRERKAQELDKPRGRILKDEALQQLAMQPPRSREEVERLRFLPSGFGRSRHGASLIEAVEMALADPEPWIFTPPPLPPRGTAQGELLRVFLKHVAEREGVAARLIASVEDLDRIASEDCPDVRAMSGWRFELFGRQALALKSGELALSVREGAVCSVEIGKRG